MWKNTVVAWWWYYGVTERAYKVRLFPGQILTTPCPEYEAGGLSLHREHNAVSVNAICCVLSLRTRHCRRLLNCDSNLVGARGSAFLNNNWSWCEFVCSSDGIRFFLALLPSCFLSYCSSWLSKCCWICSSHSSLVDLYQYITFLFEVPTSGPLGDVAYQNVIRNDYGRYYVTNQLPFMIYKTNLCLYSFLWGTWNKIPQPRRKGCRKVMRPKFYVLLTVHLDVILVNDQLDALFLNVFISAPLHVSSSKC